MFHPSEVELAETTKRILRDVEELKPTRVVFDSLSELRLLAGTALRYRRQILALKQFFATRECTVILLDDMTATDHDLQVQSIAHGVILLEQLNPEYGSERRRLRVVKYRGVHFRGGYHDYLIKTGGIEVFPRLVAAEHRLVPEERAKLPSDIAELDALLGGGIEEGHEHADRRRGRHGQVHAGRTVRLARRPAAGNARHCSCLTKARRRCSRAAARLASNLAEGVASGQISLQQIDPAELTPGEFVHSIRQEVEVRGAKIIVIDSLNGYAQCDARGTVSDDPVARTADVSRPAPRGDDSDRRAPGLDRQPDEHARRCRPIWPTR